MRKQSSVFSPEDFLSRPQVAEILGVCKTTITTAIQEGWLETVTIGERHYVLRETVENVVAERKIANRLGIGRGG